MPKLAANLSFLFQEVSFLDRFGTAAAAGFTGVDPQRGLKFESSALSYEAALQGIGVAIGVRVLVEAYLRAGTLVCPFTHTCRLDEGYYLVSPKNRPTTSALKAFRDWVRREASTAAPA